MDRLHHDSSYDTRRTRRPQRSSTDDSPSLFPSESRTSASQHFHAKDRNDLRDDSRYHYPPPSPSDRHRPQRSPLRRCPSWPPQSFVEDEKKSLLRESNARQLLAEVEKDETPFRGTVDQDPVILDVPEYQNQHERRFVFANKSDSSSQNGIPTPPTSEDESVRKARRKPSRLTVNCDDNADTVPEMNKRASSPYAFTKPDRSQRGTSTSSRVGSSDNSTPPFRSSRSGTLPKSPSSRRDSGRLSPNARRGTDYFQIPSAGSNHAVDESGSDRKRVPSRETNLTDRPVTESPRVSAFDSATPIRKLNLDSRRNTDGQESMPTLGRLNIDKSRKPTPLMASNSLSEAHDFLSTTSSSTLNPRSADLHGRSREASQSSSRPVSPAGSTGQGLFPSRSSRVSAELPKEGSFSSSRPSSVPVSRPASPSPRTPLDSPRVARTELDWSGFLQAANASRRPKPPTRPAEPTVSQPTTSSLPYPEDDSLMGSTVLMPEERDHAYQPDTRPVPATSYSYDSQSLASSTTPAPSIPVQVAASRAPRPTLTRGYSTSITSSPTETRHADRTRTSELKRTESFATSSETSKELAALMRKELPVCSRLDPVSGYCDWYTLNGATNLDFCPDCIDAFERTIFRSHFRRSPPRNVHTKIRCAFSSPWTRLAWLLTLKQDRTDLTLLKDLAEIEGTSEPCPGAIQTVHSWYGLRDPDGLFVRDFHVCFGDVRKIERLLPSLSGMFVKLPQRISYEKRTCAMCVESNRFSTYMDALVATHEKAHSSRKGADPMPLIDLVERKTRLRECTRDNLLIGGLWHFMPDTPALTVCEDCFESVVEPEIRKGSSIAKKFNRAVQPAYGEGVGSSCQLYSRRMRQVFQRAVDDGDMKYLSRKAKERREAELYLQERHKDILRKAKILSQQERDVTEEDERRLNRELEKISLEWKTKWE